jgi:hypothetical protein
MFFQAASFLKNILARNTWDILRIYSINTYLGPPDNIIYDIEKNFVSVEFRQHAKSIVIQVQEMPVKAYNSIGKIKQYYIFLQQVYEIIYDEFRDTNAKMSL